MQQINVTEFGVRREELKSRFQELIRKCEALVHVFAFFKPWSSSDVEAEPKGLQSKAKD
jgi:hypothetical protein